MDKLIKENIDRIKELMLVENDDQLSLFSNKGKPININSDDFTKKYKEKVYYILKDLYSSNWDSDRSRGPGGGGGVVNVHTVYDLLKKKGLVDLVLILNIYYLIIFLVYVILHLVCVILHLVY